MVILNKIKLFLLLLFISSYSSVTLPNEKPIITLALGFPDLGVFINNSFSLPVYRIQIFAQGQVEYLGVKGVKVLGQRRFQMDQATLTTLLKKFQDSNFKALAKRKKLYLPYDAQPCPECERDPDIDMYRVIRFRQGTDVVDVVSWDATEELSQVIILATKTMEYVKPIKPLF